MSAVRNYRECKLYKDDIFVKEFKSIKETLGKVILLSFPIIILLENCNLYKKIAH